MDFSEFEHNAWEAKASRYEGTWGSVTRTIVDVLLDFAELRKGEHLLDIGCGPGHLCHAATLRGAIAQGGDYSEAMLAIARENYPAISFLRVNAESPELLPNQFDVVTLNYLLLHVADQGKAITSAKGLLREGGRLVYSMWREPARSPGLAVIFSALKQFADMSVIPPASDPFLFSDERYAQDFFRSNGFSQVSFEEVQTAWRVENAEQFFTAIQAGTRLGGMVDLQTTEIKAAIKNAVIREVQQFREKGGYLIPTPSLMVKGIIG